MKETNQESRGIDSPTDILSFPFHFHEKPGLLDEPEFDIPDYYTLGDMMVGVPYVIRRCKEDEDDDEGDDDERGVSGAMADVTDPEKRIHMLLVHGMLHLVGYDHEEDDEYEEMVEREEKLLKELGYIE
jgi:probable rRNA maturation factor